MLASREGLGYAFASDCRGHGVFQPSIGPPQVCANLPTWDEAVGRDGVDDSTWNAHVRSCMREDDLDVLTVHAEVEGGRGAAMFGALLDMLVAEGVEVVPLGDLLPAGELDPGRIVRGSIPGREGWLGVRGAAA
jgi:undecaprenyl phosphate-alpha-L-ara4FN deformylase